MYANMLANILQVHKLPFLQSLVFSNTNLALFWITSKSYPRIMSVLWTEKEYGGTEVDKTTCASLQGPSPAHRTGKSPWSAATCICDDWCRIYISEQEAHPQPWALSSHRTAQYSVSRSKISPAHCWKEFVVNWDYSICLYSQLHSSNKMPLVRKYVCLNSIPGKSNPAHESYLGGREHVDYRWSTE